MPRNDPRENRLVDDIRARLAARGMKTLKVHGDRFQPAGTPDIIGSRPTDGRMCLIEVKLPNGEVSIAQLVEIRGWRGSGAIAFVACSADEAEDGVFGD